MSGRRSAARSAERPGRLSRRALLIAGAAAPLGACAVLGGDEPAATPPPRPPHPDEALAAAAAAAERELIALYNAAAAAHPGLVEDLAAFADRHTAHLEAVDPTVATAAPPVEQEAPALPGDADETVAVLRDAERASSEERLGACLDAEDRDLAGLLAQIAACEAAHERLLRGLL